MADLRQSILLDSPKEVDIAAIERELAQLWQQASDDLTNDGAPVVRACSLNVIIFSAGAERVSGLDEIVSQVTVDHPSRIFLLSADRQVATPGIEAWVSARCSLPVPGGKQVCCEEINLSTKGTDASKVPSIVTSLLVPDIPTILIWKATLDARDNILQQLTQIVDRVLIDSSEELHPVGSLMSWGRFIEERYGRTAFGDLAWTHLTSWRALLAQAFQPVEARRHLSHIDSVTIEYSSTNRPMHSGLSQALLATAWLAHSLQWVLIHPFERVNDEKYVAKFRLNELAITTQLARKPPQSASPGRIESLTLYSSTGGEISYKTIEPDDCVQQRTSLAGMVAGQSVVSVHHQTEAELVSNELEILYHDPSYESTMQTLTTLLGNGSR